uniref:Uncharacterized protein n=1 Tax=Photinus pyralis TaxID=7054 RepID=A0A1Y1MFC2_PHOPY
MPILAHLSDGFSPGIRFYFPDQVVQLMPRIERGLAGLRALEEDQLNRLNQFLEQELGQFRTSPGRTNAIEHTIVLKPGVEPQKQRYYPRNPVSSLAMAPVRRSLRQRRAVRRVNPWCPRRFHPDPATPKATVRKFSGPMVSPMVRKVEQLKDWGHHHKSKQPPSYRRQH